MVLVLHELFFLNLIEVVTPGVTSYRVDANIFLPLYAAEAWYFGAPKYPKRFVNPAMSLLHNPMRIKKTVALRLIRCVCVFFWSD